MSWQILDTGLSDAQGNMTLDADLLAAGAGPILHFYGWKHPSATFGYFIKPEEHLNMAGAARHGLDLARRPTGGGIVFHICDLAFSVIIPEGHEGYSLNTMDNYAYVNSRVLEAIKRFDGGETPVLLPEEPAGEDAHCENFCMAKPTKYDVMLHGRKVGGGAQRRTKSAILHQGTISLSLPSEDLLSDILLPNTCVLAAMRRHSCLLVGQESGSHHLEQARDELKALLKAVFLC